MQAKQRYAALMGCICTLAVILFIFGNMGGASLENVETFPINYRPANSAPDFNEFNLNPAKSQMKSPADLASSGPCSMSLCFNFSRCARGFRVYVYPQSAPRISDRYGKIVQAIEQSPFYTPNLDDACIFVLRFDSLDRDRLSSDFVPRFQEILDSLPLWNNGENHLIFNLFSGSWPEYRETDLHFNPGYAMLAKASFSEPNYRDQFDISLPLFHAEIPLFDSDLTAEPISAIFPPWRQYFVAFKGKRYVYGIGSETRNSLYHIHDGLRSIMLTTCKHGKNWQEMQDERCEIDNDLYDQWDYNTLLYNSTFCLVPRGRRLGSFRFLETLRAGCIPVILSNGWVLPFSEIIDWGRAVVRADERLLFLVPALLRGYSARQVFDMRQRCQKLYRLYFSSVDKIVRTGLRIIQGRIDPQRSIGVTSEPAGFSAGPLNSENSSGKLPTNFVSSSASGLTIILQDPAASLSGPALLNLFTQFAKFKDVRKILLLWNSNQSLSVNFPDVIAGKIPILILDARRTLYDIRNEINTPAVLLIDAQLASLMTYNPSILTSDDLTFALNVWRQFSDSLIGWRTGSHFWEAGNLRKRGRWRYSCRLPEHFSMILGGALIFHRYYFHLLGNWLPISLAHFVAQKPICADIALNFLISDVSKRPPIKIWDKNLPDLPDFDQLACQKGIDQKTRCLNDLAKLWDRVPLISSRTLSYFNAGDL